MDVNNSLTDPLSTSYPLNGLNFSESWDMNWHVFTTALATRTVSLKTVCFEARQCAGPRASRHNDVFGR